LQVGVGPCLHQRVGVVPRILSVEPRPEQVEALYKAGARLRPTLQVREEMWPPDRAAFEEYWQDGLSKIQLDDLSRGYLRDLAELRFLPAPVRLPLASTNRFLPLGFLPQRFRDELGYSWTPRDQRPFEI